MYAVTAWKMNMQEQFFKDQIRIIHNSRNEKEEDFERMQQEEREKVKQLSTSHLNAEERRLKYVIFVLRLFSIPLD